MSTEPKTDRMTRDEAVDLSAKLAKLDEDLSPAQRNFLHFAVNHLSEKNRADVEGYDMGYWHDTGYYDVRTGLEIYAVDWYNDWGAYEGTTYFED